MKLKKLDNKELTKLQPTWKNEPTCEDLKSDYDAAESSHEAYKEKLLKWELLREGGKKITPTKVGKSTARPKVIRKANEYNYSNLEEPFLNTEDMFEILPRTFEDKAAAEQNQHIINYQWSTKVDKVRLIQEVVRYIVDEGTVIVKTGWEVEEEIQIQLEERPIYASPEESLMMMEQAVQMGEMSPEEAAARMEAGEPMVIGTEQVEVEVPVLVKNQPKYEVCNNANVIIDPTCEGVLADANFVIHEYDTNMAELKKEEYFKDAETGEIAGVYHNLDKIKVDSEESAYDEHKTDKYNDFKFNDKARKKLTAYEYWGYWDINGDDVLVPIVATWVGNTLIRLEKNPFPHGKLPFSVATYMPIKKEIVGETDAEILEENQEAIGKLTRAAHDITAEQAVGQEFIDEQLFPSQAVKNQYEKGNTVYFRTGFNPKSSMHKKSIDPIPQAVFDLMSKEINDADSLSGTKTFGDGGLSGKALGDSVGTANRVMDATSKRKLSILRGMANMFKDIARLTISMNQVYLQPEEVIRITNGEFVQIRRDEIQGEFDLKIDISTPEKDADTADKLMKLMQTNAAKQDPELAKIFYEKLLKLWKMPAEARQVKEFQPTPDPVQQELQQVALEEAKLKVAKLHKEIEEIDSRISERVSRTIENQNSDGAMKQAKAEESLARAELYREQADNLAMEFIEKSTGAKRQAEIDDMEFKAQVEERKQQNKGQK